LADTQLNLANLDSPQEALSRIEEAIEIYHRLGANGMPGLVRSWTQASDVLRRMSRHQDALTAACQASIRYQNLAIQGFEALSLRAEVLVALGASLGVCGHLAKALAAYEQAVALLRELHHLRPDQIRPRLARSLLGHSSAALALRQGEQALDLVREAITLQRKLVEERPDLYLPELVRSLNRLSDLLVALGRSDEGASAQEEAQWIAVDVQCSDLAPENG
jgi:tetratricopeptide (TPR) repeat protein